MLLAYLRFSVVVGVLVTAAPVAAEEPASGASARAKARIVAEEGLKHFDARRWNDAYERFREADALYHAPTLTLFMARSLREMGKLVEARSSYEQLLAEPATKGVYAEARESARTELALLVPRIASVEAVVTGVPYQMAGVRLDGVPLPEGRRSLNPGVHRIEAGAKAGYVTETFTVGEGEHRKIEIRAPRQASATPAAPPRASPALVIGGGVASAVALGMGVGLAAWSSSAAAARDTYRAVCLGGDTGGCDQFDAHDQRRWLTGNAAVYSFIGAGVLAIATTTYALVAPRIKRPNVSAVPKLGTAAGLTLSW